MAFAISICKKICDEKGEGMRGVWTNAHLVQLGPLTEVDPICGVKTV